MKTLCTLLVFLCALASCVTERGARNYLAEHPDFGAHYCSQFITEDSTTQAGDTTRHHHLNEDHTNAIDSLYRVIDSLNEEFAHGYDGLSEQVAGPIRTKLLEARTKLYLLQEKMAKLQRSYKPCVPDTVRIKSVVFKTNIAPASYQKHRADSLLAVVNKLQGKGAANKKILTWSIAVSALLAILLFVAFYFKRKI